MKLETGLPHSSTKQYKRIEVPSRSSHPASTSFFYVGKNMSNIHLLLEMFVNGHCAESFASAKVLLQKTAEIHSAQPGFILIDLPYEKKETGILLSFLHGHPSFLNVPVLYNSAQLTPGTIQQLKKQKAVDDIIEFTGGSAFLASKIHMLRRVKSYLNPKTTHKVTIETSGEAIGGVNNYIKRAFDIIIASFLILLNLPVFLLVAIAIKLESRGPVFYAAKRAGRGYKIFRFYKFRTMVLDADKKVEAMQQLNQYKDESSVFFKVKNDPRVTKVGNILRNLSLDELPQLFNVLRGDMSLVGNRPLPLYEAAGLTTDEWAERFMAPAGITGLWQIKKRGQKDMSATERINLDIAYANQSNFIYDLWIIANTPSALIQKENV